MSHTTIGADRMGIGPRQPSVVDHIGVRTMSDQGASTMRVAVVDDHRTMAELLGRALDNEPDLTFVGTADTVALGVALVEREQPDVLLLDLNLPDGNGLWLAREVHRRWPAVRVVILTAETDASLVGRAAEAGACGFLPKTGSLDEVLEVLRASRSGSMVASRLMVAALSGRGGRIPSGPSLTSRELDVLQELADGRDVATAARRLGISPHTARGYVKSILVKLDCHSQLEAVVTAAKLGLLRLHQAS